MEFIEANWLLILLVAVAAIAILWYIFHAARRTRVTGDRRDVLDEGASPAARNQALIDAAPAASPSARTPAPAPVPAPTPAPTPAAPPVAATPAGLAGVGEAVVAGVTAENETAEAQPTPEPSPAATAAPAAAPAPVPTPAPVPVAASAAPTDDVSQIKGVGPKLVAQLNELGIISITQIAQWTEADVDRIDGQLGRFQGRIRRDAWVEQAKLLTSGDADAYAARFGNRA